MNLKDIYSKDVNPWKLCLKDTYSWCHLRTPWETLSARYIINHLLYLL